MNALVEKAIAEIRDTFKPTQFDVEPDDSGGARVRFGPVALETNYVQRETWLAGHIPAQIPYADIYPIFVRGDLKRSDGSALIAPVTSGHHFMGTQAVQVSRRSNGRDPSIETPAKKFAKVLNWLNCQ